MTALAKQTVIYDGGVSALEAAGAARGDELVSRSPTGREKQKAALLAMKAAARHDKSLRWSIFVMTLRSMSPWQAGLYLLVVGAVLAAAALCLGWPGSPGPGDNLPSFAYEDEAGVCPKLKLEKDLTAH